MDDFLDTLTGFLDAAGWVKYVFLAALALVFGVLIGYWSAREYQSNFNGTGDPPEHIVVRQVQRRFYGLAAGVVLLVTLAGVSLL